MPWGSKPSRLEALDYSQRSSWDGNLKGRIRQARPVVRQAIIDNPLDEGDEDPFENPVKFMQDTFTITHSGEQTLSLSYVPIDNSEHLYWEGYYQRGDQWSRAADTNKIRLPDPLGLLSVGDKITVEYAYIEGNEYSPAQIAFDVVGATTYDGGGGTFPYTSAALPVGSKKGDLMIMGLIGGGDYAGGAAYSLDPRMNLLTEGFYGGRLGKFYYGYVTDDPSPIDVYVHGSTGYAIAQFICVNLTVLRGADADLRLDTSRIGPTIIDQPGGVGNIPAPGGSGSGAVAVTYRYNGIGGVGTPNWSVPGSQYAEISNDGTYIGISMGKSGAEVVGSSPTPNLTDGWGGFSVGLEYG